MKIDIILEYLDYLYPNPKCELNYNKDYELLIATILSAQCTDKRVNEVTDILFNQYTINDLNEVDVKEIEKIIYPVGTYTKKAKFIKEVASSLVTNHKGIVPNDRKYLESLPGVGRKTCNVVLSNLFDEPCIAVDTHVERVAKRLGLASAKDDVLKVEKKLMKIIAKDRWSKTHHQLVLFGRYNCQSRSPKCDDCKLKDICKYKKSN